MRALLMIAAAAMVIAPAGGCAEPDFAECTVQCDTDSDCPSSLTCNGEGYCTQSSTATCTTRPDAGSPSDGAPIDAPMPPMSDGMSDDGGMPPFDAGDDDGGGPPPFDGGGPDGDPPFEPSNGLGSAQLSGVTGAIDTSGSDDVIIDTVTGEIRQGTTTLRDPGQGIHQGISFTFSDDGFAFGVTSVDLDAPVRVDGDNPLQIVSAGDVHITGVIDATGGCVIGSDSFCGGPGGGDGDGEPFCGAGNEGTGQNGGGGGGYGQAGAGGIGAECSLVFGGGVCGSASIEPLTGGGGGGIAAGSGADGGGGGGAVQIVSFTTIVIGSAGGGLAGINVGGAGGEGQFGGGGGGGAGGAILLEAPAITLHAAAVLAANGGGGGCGSITGAGETGALSSVPARGGCPGGTNPGGRGGALNMLPAPGSCEAGHGGGAGRIRINVPASAFDDFGAIISPKASRGG